MLRSCGCRWLTANMDDPASLTIDDDSPQSTCIMLVRLPIFSFRSDNYPLSGKLWLHIRRSAGTTPGGIPPTWVIVMYLYIIPSEAS